MVSHISKTLVIYDLPQYTRQYKNKVILYFKKCNFTTTIYFKGVTKVCNYSFLKIMMLTIKFKIKEFLRVTWKKWKKKGNASQYFLNT